jgi:hypothetical protein
MVFSAVPIIEDFLGILFGGPTKSFQGKPEEGLNADFVPHYQKFIKPLVEKYEKSRLEALHKVKQRGWAASTFTLIVVGLAFYLNIYKNIEFFNLGTNILLLISGGLFCYAYYPILTLKSDIKGGVFPLIFRYFGSDFSYRPQSTLSAKSLRESGIVDQFDQEKNEDYIRGSYKGVSIELMESVLTRNERIQRQGKFENRSIELFRGLFILFDMNKSFSGKTIVRRDSGRIGNWFMSKTSALEMVELEDPVFEEKFRVMSTNQIEARYLLTSSFMERLIEVDDIFKCGEYLEGGGLQCSFYNNRLLMSISSRQNRFEVRGVLEPITFVNEINDIMKQMRSIFAIIETLKLNERTGL